MATQSDPSLLRRRWREAYVGLAVVVAVVTIALGTFDVIPFLWGFLIVTGMVGGFLVLMAVFGGVDRTDAGGSG